MNSQPPLFCRDYPRARLPSIEESADRINKVNEQVKDITDQAQAISKIHRGDLI